MNVSKLVIAVISSALAFSTYALGGNNDGLKDGLKGAVFGDHRTKQNMKHKFKKGLIVKKVHEHNNSGTTTTTSSN